MKCTRGSGTDERLALKPSPVGFELAAKLRDAAGRNVEAVGRLCGGFAGRQRLGNAAFEPRQSIEPVAEIDATRGHLSRRRTAVLDDDLLPDATRIAAIKTFDVKATMPLGRKVKSRR